MLQILGGTMRSRRLQVPDGERTRPMGSRTKEAVFNMLRGWFDGARVLDLFAGVGTMGLEAASRGASHVVCVEQDRSIGEFLQANILALGCTDRVRWVQSDALGPVAIAAAPAPVDLVFCDPPFVLMQSEASRTRLLEQLAGLKAVMAPKSFLVLRAPEVQDAAAFAVVGFDGPELHSYGREQHVLLYMPSSGSTKVS
ncbi:MAG: 16S rRNA (guanine(966)-N(2))-methyltransferase RsmD [Planctomycetes bacterium]|nr:16S rRNA (guanine(966)-N(2))-methyltransferase RsmD [Planctomycetota bacterium]